MEMLWAATKNYNTGPENIRLLLGQSTVKEIPNQVVMAAVSNRSAGLEMMTTLLSYPEKLHVTEDMLVAAARNTDNGPIIISMLISRYGVSILPSFVLEHPSFSNGVAVEDLLLLKWESSLTSGPIQPSGLLSEFLKAWERKMALDFEDFTSIKQPKFTAATPVYVRSPKRRPISASSSKRDEYLENFRRNNWIEDPIFQELFVESSKYLAVLLARRTERILNCHVNSTKHDIQGIDWNFLGITRKDARKLRTRTAVPFRSASANFPAC